MIAIDTNVLLRHVTQDDPVQALLASQLLEKHASETGVFLPLVALAEFVWALSYRYHFEKKQIVSVLELLLETEGLVCENHEVAVAALETYRTGDAGYCDYLIVESASEAEIVETYTFDKKLLRDKRCRRPSDL